MWSSKSLLIVPLQACVLIDWLIDCWLSHCNASERDCEPRGLYPDSLQPIESVPRNFNEHTQVDFLPKDKRSNLLQNKWISPPPLELWLRRRLVYVYVWGVFASLTAHLDLAFHRPSKSPLASPFFFIQKKDSSLCPIQDYQYLNSIMIKNKYPLPLISDLIDKLKNAMIFMKFDIQWGYNNVRIWPEDEWKTAFKTNRGLFKPLVMFFKPTNSPATFQAMMNKIFTEEIWKGHIIIYLDDILIFSDNLDQHCSLIARVLRKLHLHKLYLNPEKCEFEKELVNYLGMIVGGGEVQMEEKKVEAIRNWEAPLKKKDLQWFLGFVNFYHKFIKDFSKITCPLHELTRNVLWG